MEFIVSRNILLRALQHTRCAITKGELNIFKNFVLTFPDDPKKTDGTELIKGNSFLRVGMKGVSLSQTLKVLSSENVVFHFVDHTRAIIIYPVPQPDTENVTMLLMPMLIND